MERYKSFFERDNLLLSDDVRDVSKWFLTKYYFRNSIKHSDVIAKDFIKRVKPQKVKNTVKQLCNILTTASYTSISAAESLDFDTALKVAYEQMWKHFEPNKGYKGVPSFISYPMVLSVECDGKISLMGISGEYTTDQTNAVSGLVGTSLIKMPRGRTSGMYIVDVYALSTPTMVSIERIKEIHEIIKG